MGCFFGSDSIQRVIIEGLGLNAGYTAMGEPDIWILPHYLQKRQMSPVINVQKETQLENYSSEWQSVRPNAQQKGFLRTHFHFLGH